VSSDIAEKVATPPFDLHKPLSTSRLLDLAEHYCS
jgi:hypothetical protein